MCCDSCVAACSDRVLRALFALEAMHVPLPSSLLYPTVAFLLQMRHHRQTPGPSGQGVGRGGEGKRSDRTSKELPELDSRLEVLVECGSLWRKFVSKHRSPHTVMFDKLKNWTLNVLECRTSNDAESCTADFYFHSSDMDPRELPRPYKQYPYLDLPSHAEERSCALLNGCTCHNCKELVELAECPICAGGYQKGVTACDHCGNVMCWSCAARMPSCPFCRRHRPPARNTALERIFNKLQLPCTPARLDLGKKSVETEFTELECLARKDCPWTGDLGSLASHLEADHSISVLVGNGLTIEIGGFRSKVRASDRHERQYTVSLACYAAIFVLNISLRKKKMRLLFTGASSHTSQRFGAWLEVESSYRTMKGILPVSTQRNRHKELYISCNGLLSPWRYSEDLVRINITIRPLS